MPNLSDKLCNALDVVRSELESEHVLDNLKEKFECQIQEIKHSKKVELILDETSSRIKSNTSFKEKIARKNYLKDWGLNEDSNLEDCKKAIREKLSDLIGIRVNCFFKDDEELIYKHLVEKLETFSQDFLDHPTTEPPHFFLPTNYKDDVTELKTKDKLYKISCGYEYKNSTGEIQSCFFELQIKCLAHNLWGEVEHEISYKAPQYDYAFQSKNKQLCDIYSSLKSSDSQLKTLYTCQEYSKQDLFNSLFFLYTKDIVTEKLNGKNPTQLYTWFFQIFKKDEALVTNYIKKQLVPDFSFSKSTLCINKTDKILDFFVKYVIQTYFLGKFNDLTAIAKLLYENVDEQDICWLIGYEIIQQIKVDDQENTPSISSIIDEMNEDDEEDDESFMSDENSNEDDHSYSPVLYRGCAKAQKAIYDRINQQVDSYLTKNEKTTLTQCVDSLCYVISGGLKDA